MSNTQETMRELPAHNQGVSEDEVTEEVALLFQDGQNSQLGH